MKENQVPVSGSGIRKGAVPERSPGWARGQYGGPGAEKNRGTILIADDERSLRENLGFFFRKRGFQVCLAEDGKSAYELCRTTPVDLVLLDLRLPDTDGLEALQIIKSVNPRTAVVIITAFGDTETAVRAIKLKADDFVAKPIDLEALEAVVARSLGGRKRQVRIESLRLSQSRRIGYECLRRLRPPEAVYEAVQMLVDNPGLSFLVRGEDGTGKRRIARMIHDLSNRRAGAFVEANPAEAQKEEFEIELFGHQDCRTGARMALKGLVDEASGGSLYLNEVESLTRPLQDRLAKLIEFGVYSRAGEARNLKADVRIVFSTRSDPVAAIRTGALSRELYNLVSVFSITLPPLRKRRDDILPLAEIFREEISRETGRKTAGFSPPAKKMLLGYLWPGNIRELRRAVELAVITSEGVEIRPEHLPEEIRNGQAAERFSSGDDLSLAAGEKRQIGKVVEMCGGNLNRSAQTLGIDLAALIEKIKKYNL